MYLRARLSEVEKGKKTGQRKKGKRKENNARGRVTA